MAFCSYVDINPADEILFLKGATPNDRFSYSKMRKSVGFFSRHRKFVLKNKSLLPQISFLWCALSPLQKNIWSSVGIFSGMNGWRCFVAEMSIRIKLGLSTNYTPSFLHQGWFGHIVIGGSAQQIKIAQYHPASYYIRHKVAGKKGMYEPVEVQEVISLPLEIGLSYKANLVQTLSGAYAKFYAVVYSSYQGVDRENIVEIPLTPNVDWNAQNAVLSSARGYVFGYAVYFHIYGYQGDLYFDNIKMVHGGVNWARDKKCSDVNASFSPTFYQVPRNWVALELPAGAYYDSDYIDF